MAERPTPLGRRVLIGRNDKTVIQEYYPGHDSRIERGKFINGLTGPETVVEVNDWRPQAIWIVNITSKGQDGDRQEEKALGPEEETATR